jgi:hypothetical protein
MAQGHGRVSALLPYPPHLHTSCISACISPLL